MIGIQLDPVDTWFFRDGTPFTADETISENVGSSFPPSPATITGALRAALALCNGWNGRGLWCSDHTRVLGDGPEDLGDLSVEGPFLLRRGEPLFRAPRLLLGEVCTDGWKPSVFLRPGSKTLCDLGEEVRLPVPDASGNIAKDKIPTLKTGDDWWLTRRGMKAVLWGTLPCMSEVVSSRELWSEEPRIGLKIDRNTRTAEEGQLYSTRHVRLARGVSLGARISGIPDDWNPPSGFVPLGGEGRLAECHEWNIDPKLDMPLDEIKSNRRVKVIALSPLDLDQNVYCNDGSLTLTPIGQVVSACLDRPQRIGGWDSRKHKPRPLPLRSVLPPGSVLFCETNDPESFLHAIMGNGGLPRVGLRKEWGFGLVALGTWPD